MLYEVITSFGLNVGLGNQFVGTIGNNCIGAFRGGFKMELQADNPLADLKGLIV